MLCAFAIHLTQHPQEHESDDYTIILKTAGISDEEILDVVLVTYYLILYTGGYYHWVWNWKKIKAKNTNINQS